MKKLLLTFACLLAAGYTTKAQLLVSTLAGSAASGSLNGTSSAASFNHPFGVCVDSSGNLYVADAGNSLVRKITPAGVVTTLAGSGTPGLVNGTGTAASFYQPIGICADGSGNIYVADNMSSVFRMITPAGVASTFAGSGVAGTNDGPVASAQFVQPYGVACDIPNNIIYVTDGTMRIRKIAGGMVSTLAGSGAIGFANGTGTLATFNSPNELCVDPSGNIYVADFGNNAIRKITPAGVVTTLAGSGTVGNADGVGTAASFDGPIGISIDPAGNLYVSESSGRIRTIDPSGLVTTISGSAGPGFLDGNAQAAQFEIPCSVACFTDGTVYISDQYNNRIRMISCSALNAPSNTTPAGNLNAYTGISSTLTASGPGTINWYTTATGGTAIATGTACITSPTLAAGVYTYYVDAATSCTTSARTAVTFTVYIPSGINSIQNSLHGVSVYPNPTAGMLTVELNSGDLKIIEVSDLTGLVLLSSSTPDTRKQVNLNAFASGVYYLKVQSGKATSVMKVVKQ